MSRPKNEIDNIRVLPWRGGPPPPPLERLLALARSLPMFAEPHGERCDAPGMSGEFFDGEAFAQWVRATGWANGEDFAAKFLLHVWDHNAYPFDLTLLNQWDKEHLKEFAE